MTFVIHKLDTELFIFGNKSLSAKPQARRFETMASAAYHIRHWVDLLSYKIEASK